MPKESLRDKLDGNELDLSLNDLTEVPPVKEIAALPKATNIDLSCNLITIIPVEFCQQLSHIVKLDLSKNKLKELPSNIGYLQKLQHLDLLDNKLVTLPVGIAQLKNLKWLDLKYNPLSEPLVSVVGECSDETQCRTCARKVVAFMKNVQAEQERQLQKHLQEEREIEALKQQEEEKVRQRKKQEKQAEKLKRKKEHELKMAQQKKEAAEQAKSEEQETEESDVEPVSKPTGKVKKTSKGGLGCCGVFACMVLGLLTVCAAFYFYCETDKDNASCILGHRAVRGYLTQTQTLAEHYIKLAKHFINDIQGKH